MGRRIEGGLGKKFSSLPSVWSKSRTLVLEHLSLFLVEHGADRLLPRRRAEDGCYPTQRRSWEGYSRIALPREPCMVETGFILLGPCSLVRRCRHEMVGVSPLFKLSRSLMVTDLR